MDATDNKYHKASLSNTSKADGRAVATTAFPEATDVALAILRAGGNAIDAAVAAAWALAVCEPAGSGLGGQTSMMIRLANGEVTFLDGHSVAPAAVSMRTVSARQQDVGFRACTVPSTPATLEVARRRFGTMRSEVLLEPAIRLARDGFVVTALQQKQARWRLNAPGLQKDRNRVLRKACWLEPRRGRLAQPRLARTLERLAACGVDDFYRGQLAQAIADDMSQNGGLLCAEDLSRLSLPIRRKPIAITYRGHEVLTSPPPGGGLQLALALRLLERLLPAHRKLTEATWYESVALAVYAAFDEREKFPIHPDDFTPSVAQWALGEQRADEIADRLLLSRYLLTVPGDEEPGETTHLCVADSKGNIVSLTQSIQSLFGALVSNWELGFLYNNYLTTCTRYPHPYQLGPRCLPRSNAVPTLVTMDGDVMLALGAAGSRRIVSSVVQIISRVIDQGMSLTEAVAAPRVHALLNGCVWLEKHAGMGDVHSRLASLFNRVIVRSAHSFSMGGAQAIQFELGGAGEKTAVADPRRDGKTGGLYN